MESRSIRTALISAIIHNPSSAPGQLGPYLQLYKELQGKLEETSDQLSKSAQQAELGAAKKAAGAKAVAVTPPREAKKRADADARKQARAEEARRARIADLESRIAETEKAIKELEAQMSAPGFYDDRVAAQPVIDRHQALMWTVGDLMNQWESLNE